MKRFLFVLSVLSFSSFCFAQSVTQKLNNAFAQFENDAQLKSAMASLYVVDAKTGAVVFEKNSTTGLAPASTQKIFTSATAYALLGKDFRYKTEFSFAGNLPVGNIIIKASGDPTLGSWRWESTKEEALLKRLLKDAQTSGIKSIGSIKIDDQAWTDEPIPDGWIWQDVGNYYGAGAHGVNWRENQYDVVLKSGAQVGDSVAVVTTNPKVYTFLLQSQLTAAAKGSGDNAYIYLPTSGTTHTIRGTIPVNENHFVISGAIPNINSEVAAVIQQYLCAHGICTIANTNNPSKISMFHTEYSPPLDSIVYWFLRKSINLYGEALIKTLAFQKEGKGITSNGVDILKSFWADKGIAKTEINIVDGSGLSPLNRVTTHAQVSVLQFAKKQPWFSGYYYALPEYNGMKMKSGTINGVKGFAGYHTAKDGKEYIFSFLVNNYNGPSGSLVQKMYAVLNVLK